MTNNKQQTAVDWLWEIAYNRELTVEDWKQAKERYNDEIESAIIKQCAEESTSAAHHKELHRQQIIEAYISAKMERNLVKKHFAYFLKLERVTQKAQEYYNETYNKTK